MDTVQAKYFAALARLVARGDKINNDSVALEAGFKKGTIKKSRPAQAQLIKAIEEASEAQKKGAARADPLPALQEAKRGLERLLDESREREVALLDEVFRLRAEIAAIHSQSVSPIGSKRKGTATAATYDANRGTRLTSPKADDYPGPR